LTGPQGDKGDKGDKGDAGANGLAGTDGKDGTNGAQGPAGATGLQGPAGADGKDGAQGPAGPAGTAGAITVEAVLERAVNNTGGCFQPAVAYNSGPYYYKTSPAADSGLFDSAGALRICAYSLGVNTPNILRSFTPKAPVVAAGATLALSDVYDAAASAFIAPRAGLYSLSYTLHIGLPFQYTNGMSTSRCYFYSGAATLWAVVSGERQLVERLDGGVHSVDGASGSTFPTLFWDSLTSSSAASGARKNVRSGSATMYLAAGARVTAELLFQGYSDYGSPMGLLWTDTLLRFSLLVPY